MFKSYYLPMLIKATFTLLITFLLILPFPSTARRSHLGDRVPQYVEECKKHCLARRDYWDISELYECLNRCEPDIPEIDAKVLSRRTDKERCMKRCDESAVDLPDYVRCRAICDRDYGDTVVNQGRDPKSRQREIERCQQRCQREETDPRKVQQCQQSCEERQPGKQGRESEKDPREEYKKCRELCERSPEERRECQRRCDREYSQAQKQKEWEEKEHEKGGGNFDTYNPYHIHAQKFQSPFRTEGGHIRVLGKFSDSSELLRGIENYRLALLNANPSTFIVPQHSDAESLIVVLSGQGTISYVLREKRESYSLEAGDVIRIPAGAVAYLINHGTEVLSLADLIQPVNIPGQYMDFYAAGSQSPKSYYTIFSNEVLEAALNTPRDELNKVFGQQRQGVILNIPQEKLKALIKRVSSKREKGQGPFNLLNQKPLYSNLYGRFSEASPNDCKQIQDMGVSVSYGEIKRGCLMLPHYNSMATTIVLVVGGSGSIEMACPQLESQSQQQESRPIREEEEEEEEEEETEKSQPSSKQCQMIRSNLSPGDVIVLPAGVPVALVASQNDNLLMLGFGINAWNNQRNFLAGQKDNIMNQIEREAKEVSFNAPAELIEKVFKNQKESYFAAQKREDKMGGSIPSILDFHGFF